MKLGLRKIYSQIYRHSAGIDYEVPLVLCFIVLAKKSSSYLHSLHDIPKRAKERMRVYDARRLAKTKCYMYDSEATHIVFKSDKVKTLYHFRYRTAEDAFPVQIYVETKFLRRDERAISTNRMLYEDKDWADSQKGKG